MPAQAAWAIRRSCDCCRKPSRCAGLCGQRHCHDPSRPRPGSESKRQRCSASVRSPAASAPESRRSSGPTTHAHAATATTTHAHPTTHAHASASPPASPPGGMARRGASCERSKSWGTAHPQRTRAWPRSHRSHHTLRSRRTHAGCPSCSQASLPAPHQSRSRRRHPVRDPCPSRRGWCRTPCSCRGHSQGSRTCGRST